MCGSKTRLDSEDIHVYPDRAEVIGLSDRRRLSDALMSLSELPSPRNFVRRSLHKSQGRSASLPSSGGNSQVRCLANALCLG